MTMQSINPASGEKGRAYETQTWPQVEAELKKSRAAFSGWRQSGFAERRGPLQQAARILEKEKGDLARLMSLEMGKPVLQARAEIEKCAIVCGHYAENAESMLADEVVISGAETGYVRFDPLGTILAVMPWNFPFWQVFRFAAPALMAGNVCLLKHSSNVPGCALRIGEIFRQAGFPEHVFATLLIGPDLVEPLIAHRWLDAVTLTGSEAAGRARRLEQERRDRPGGPEHGGRPDHPGNREDRMRADEHSLEQRIGDADDARVHEECGGADLCHEAEGEEEDVHRESGSP